MDSKTTKAALEELLRRTGDAQCPFCQAQLWIPLYFFSGLSVAVNRDPGGRVLDVESEDIVGKATALVQALEHSIDNVIQTPAVALACSDCGYLRFHVVYDG